MNAFDCVTVNVIVKLPCCQ